MSNPKKAEPDVQITFKEVDDSDTSIMAVPSGPRMLGTSELVTPEPPKINMKDPNIDVAAFGKKLEELQKYYAQISKNAKGQEKIPTLKDPAPVEALKPVQFEIGTPFVGLPQLRKISHPMYTGRPNAFSVAVGSQNWLNTIDELRAAGWPYYGDQDGEGIEMFLLKSAWIVFRDLNYILIKEYLADGGSEPVALDMERFVKEAATKESTEEKREQKAYQLFINHILSRKNKYINMVEKFCMAYPDATRQEEKLEVGYAKLVQEIRNKLGARAFLPKNYEDMLKNGAKAQCPPKENDFFIGNVHVKNFLRHWTRYDNKNKLWINEGGSTKPVYECAPPENLKYSWIPIEYREKIESLMNLTQFRYMDPKEYSRFMVTLTEHQELDKLIRSKDESNRSFIFVQDDEGKSYRVFLATIELDYEGSYRREEKGIPKGEKTLREWMADKSLDSKVEMYPIVHVLLNIPPPSNGGSRERPGVYKKAGFIYDWMTYKGRSLSLMYADAPLRAFKQQMIKYYLGSPKPGEDYANCIDRFVANVYKDILAKRVIPDLPEQPPSQYREVLTELLEYGGQPPECISSSTVIGGYANEIIPPAAPSKSELSKMGESEKRALQTDMKNVLTQLANMKISNYGP